jgi:hypothetical protein
MLSGTGAIGNPLNHFVDDPGNIGERATRTRQRLTACGAQGPSLVSTQLISRNLFQTDVNNRQIFDCSKDGQRSLHYLQMIECEVSWERMQRYPFGVACIVTACDRASSDVRRAVKCED